MKTIQRVALLLALILFAFVYTAEAQYPTLDILDYNKIAVTKNIGKPTAKGNKFYPGESIASLVAAFGKPQNISTQYAEIYEVDMTVYKYEGAEFYFIDGYLAGAHISGPGFYFITDTTVVSGDPYKHYYKVGDSLNRVQSSYPASYKAKREERVFLGLYEMVATNPDSSDKPKNEKRMLDDVVTFGHENGKISGFYF
jgi:hypothetical protein